jgi:hypothetical protein
MPCLPGPGRKASVRSTSEVSSPPRSRTATAARATRICTPTSRSRTRSRPSTDAGFHRRECALRGQRHGVGNLRRLRRLGLRPGCSTRHDHDRLQLKPVSTHSSTSGQPRPDATFRLPETWPLYSAGASRSPHPLTQDRCPGLPAYRQHFMIITFGPSTWRNGRSSSSASQVRSETAPATAKISPYGHRRAATRPPPFL